MADKLNDRTDNGLGIGTSRSAESVFKYFTTQQVVPKTRKDADWGCRSQKILSNVIMVRSGFDSVAGKEPAFIFTLPLLHR